MADKYNCGRYDGIYKVGVLRNMPPEELIRTLKWYETHFDPIDYDRCESYELTKAEILRRLNKEWEDRKNGN